MAFIAEDIGGKLGTEARNEISAASTTGAGTAFLAVHEGTKTFRRTLGMVPGFTVRRAAVLVSNRIVVVVSAQGPV
jgi:hypothetical protein